MQYFTGTFACREHRVKAQRHGVPMEVPGLWMPWASKIVESISMVMGESPGLAPMAHACVKNSSVSESSCGARDRR